ncbi:MAG TPA: hypothetical protein VJH63_03665 [Candidatus Paceibacterota bacterium]
MKEFFLTFIAVLIGGLLGEVPPIKRFFDKIEKKVKQTLQNAAQRAGRL